MTGASMTDSSLEPDSSRLQDSDPLARIVRVIETLEPDNCESIAALYAPKARFRDPFNDVIGSERITAIYRHMFEQVDEPRFVVTRVVGTPADGQRVLFWDFRFRFRRPLARHARATSGCTLMQFDAAGLIVDHQDYWDPAAGLYEHFPLLGGVLRRLRRRIGLPSNLRESGR